MDATKQYVIDSAQRTIDGYHKMQEAVNLLPDGLPGVLWASQWDLNLTIPYDIDMLRKVRAMLGSGWKVDSTFMVEENGTREVKYRHSSGLALCVYMESKAEGATCQRVQVGEKRIPVYKVVCNGAVTAAA